MITTNQNPTDQVSLPTDNYINKKEINPYRSAIKKFKSLLSKKTDYDAFTTDKGHNLAKWFVDGQEYFDSLYDNLMAATKSIYILGLWISPEFYLKRPVSHNINSETTMMHILKLKAEQNVKILIVVYKEIKITLNIKSDHTEKIFKNLHPNIHIVRHPKNTFVLKKWSHHEKMVIID